MKKTILFICLIGFSLNAFSQIDNNLIKVQGNAILAETPDLMLITITVNAQDPLYSTCADKLISGYNKLAQAFITTGIPEDQLKSDGLSINENISYVDRERKKDGYKGTIYVLLELPYSANSLNSIMNTLKENDFPVNYKVAFKLSNDQKDKLLQKSIELAIADATKKAKIIAASLNVELAEIQDVNFGYTNYQNDGLAKEAEVFYILDDQEQPGNGLDLNPKKLQIKKTLGIVWAIRQ